MAVLIGILISRGADRQLLAHFCRERGWEAKSTADPRRFDVGEWSDVDLLLVDELFARAHREALRAMKRRQEGVFLPILVLIGPQSSGGGWLKAGFDDILRLPIPQEELSSRLFAFLELRRQSIEIARHSEAMFRAIAEQSLVGVYLFSQDRYLYVNQALGQMTGYDPDEIIGKMHPLDLVHPDDRPLVASKIQERMSDQSETAQHRFRGLRKDGRTIYVEVFSRRIHYQDQPAILGTAIDITDQVKAEHQLQRVYRALRVLSACNQAIVRAEDETRLFQDICSILVNEGNYRLVWIGLAEQADPHNVRVAAKAGPAAAYLEDILISWKDDQWGRGPTGTAIRTGDPQYNLYPEQAPIYGPWKERAGQFQLGASIALPIKVRGRTIGALNIYAGGMEEFDPEELQLLNELAIDISYGLTALRTEIERRQTAQALAESEARIRALVEQMPIGVILLDEANQVILANPPGWEYLNILAPGIDEGVNLTELAGIPLETFLAPASGEQEWHEVVVVAPDERRRTFELNLRPLMLAEGIPSSRVLILRDVTYEREVTARAQEQARLASVGQLAAGIAHDFNNILTAIIGYAQLILYEQTLEPRLRNDLQIILEQAQRAGHLIRQLLDFSRKSLLEKGPLDVVSFMKEQAKLLHRLLPESIEIRFVAPKESIWVEADPTSLQQVITNLAVNARDAMPRGGILTLRIARRVYNQRYELPPWPDMPAGSWVLLEVEDTGCGIAPEHLPHIFEPFFTTKEAGKGTGLGLSQVYGIVRQHGGYVDVRSAVGQGSTFTVYLPEMGVFGKFDITEQPRQSQVAQLLGHGERILLVEDDERVRQVCMQTLQSAGYEVICAVDGADALEMLDTLTVPVDLVITDMVMPRVGGAELLTRLRARGFDWPALVMTGYPLDQTAEWKSLGSPHWIMKPFSLAVLLEKVRAMLRRAGGPS